MSSRGRRNGHGGGRATGRWRKVEGRRRPAHHYGKDGQQTQDGGGQDEEGRDIEGETEGPHSARRTVSDLSETVLEGGPSAIDRRAEVVEPEIAALVGADPGRVQEDEQLEHG